MTQGRWDRTLRQTSVLLIIATVALLGWMCWERQYLNIGIETDFLGRFVLEAQRILAGERLHVDIHLPGYAALLAVTYLSIPDWFTAGLLDSWFAAALALLAAWRLGLLIGDSWAGLAAVGALAASQPFLAFSAQSTNDVPFLALGLCCIWATTSAIKTGRAVVWLFAGLLAGLAFLFRTNGIVFLLIFFVPLLTRQGLAQSLREGGAFVLGFIAALVPWIAFAYDTGSPVLPTETYSNIALTYFGSLTGCSEDERRPFVVQFDSSLDVIQQDPVGILFAYVKRLFQLPRVLAGQITWEPIAISGGLAGLLYWRTWLRSPIGLMILGLLVVFTLLVNIKALQPRMLMIWAPFLGAAVGVAVSSSLAKLPASRFHRPVALLVALVCAFAVGAMFAQDRARANAEPSSVSTEIANAVAAVNLWTPADAMLIARKHVVPYYTHRELLWFPAVRSVGELCSSLRAMQVEKPLFVFIGTAEQKCRPEIARELLSEPTPVGVTLVAAGRKDDTRWTLASLSIDACAFP